MIKGRRYVLTFANDLHILLAISVLFELSSALSNIFVNVYLWKQTGQLVDLGFYNFSVIFTEAIAFVSAGWLAKRIDRVIVLRAGIVCLSAFYVTVLLLGNLVQHYLFIVGGILGVGNGLYWLAYNVLIFEITEPETRVAFNGTEGVLTSLAGMIGPYFAGAIISYVSAGNGYMIIFSLSLFLFLLGIIVSLQLKKRPASGVYQFKRILKERNYNTDWRKLTYAHFFQGLREGSFVFVITVLVFVETSSELALGTFGLVNSIVAFLAYLVIGKYMKPSQRKKAILLGGILLALAVVPLVSQITFSKLILYGVVISIGYPLVLIPYGSLTYDVIGRSWEAREYRIEYVVIKDLFSYAGRAVSVLLLIILLLLFNTKASLSLLMLVFGSGYACMYWFIKGIPFVNE